MSFPATTALPGRQRIDEPRFSLTHALGIALLLHLFFLLLITVFPQFFVAPRLLLAEVPEEPPPIKFTFIDVPDDNVVERNPDSETFSDKDRVESGETPRVTTPEGKNPPSTGNTREKIAGGVELPPPPAPVEPAQELPRPVPTQPTPPAEPIETQQEDTDDKKETEASEAQAPKPEAGPGGQEKGNADGDNQQQRNPRQERFSKALDQLAKPLPTDLQAIAPPNQELPDLKQGKSTQWSFDNPDPTFPVNIGSISFDSKGADFGDWLREFHARVLNEWSRNLDEWRQRVWQDVVGARFASDAEKWNRYATIMNGTRGVTGIIFEVTREGSVVALQLIHPSGAVELDRSVQKTLRNVLLPSLPSDYPDPSLQIRAGFYYNVDPPE